MSEQDVASIGIVTVSDRASRGEYQDLGGPAIQDYLSSVLISPWQAVPRVIPDDQTQIESTLLELCQQQLMINRIEFLQEIQSHQNRQQVVINIT